MSTRRGYRRFAGYALRASPSLALATIASALIAAVAPLAAVGAVGAVVGRVPRVLESGLDSPAGRSALLWASLAAAFLVGQWGAAALQTAAATALGERVDF